jgi:hypothetical protein
MLDIHHFVREALMRGQSKDAVAGALKKAGWSEDEVRGAVGAYADVDFPIPVPKPKPYLSAKEAFMYLVLFTCLYISAFNFGALLFQFIERAFPDALNPSYAYDGSAAAIRFSVSALIIAFPLYLWLSSVFAKAFAKDPVKRESKVRKWLSYITLFIAASVIIGDSIALIYNLLGGELTARFFLKVLAIMLIAGMIFGYYLWDLKRDEKEA